MRGTTSRMISLFVLGADRSGEADFLQMLDGCAKLRNVQIEVSLSTRDRNQDALVPSTDWMILYEKPNTFCVRLGEYWASAMGSFTSDGRTLKVDTDFTELRKAPADIGGVNEFAKGAQYFNLLFAFMRGRSAQSLVAESGDIAKTIYGIRLQTREFGIVEISLLRREGLLLPTVIDVKNLAGRMATYRMLPMFGDRPESPLERYAIGYKFVDGFPKGAFDTRVPKGTPFNDTRKGGDQSSDF